MSLYSLKYNPQYQEYIELTKDKHSILKGELRDPKVFADYQREFGTFSFMSEIFMEDNKNATKTFVAADKGYSFLHVWTPIAGDQGSTSTYCCGDNIVMFYNQYGKPFRALTAKGFIENIGFNQNYRWSNHYRQDQSTAYPQELTLADISGNTRNFLQVFDDEPLSNPLLDGYNFVLIEYSHIGNHKTLKSWARKNGLKNISTEPRLTKVRNIIVNTSYFPYNPSSINSGTEYAKDRKLNDYLTISVNTFVNIAYNLALKPGFVLTIDHLKSARQSELTNIRSFMLEMRYNNRTLTKPQIEYIENVISLLDVELEHTRNYK